MLSKASYTVNTASIVTAAILIVCVVLQWLPESIHQSLRFERESIADGELWRLFSGHLLHLSWQHFALNAAAMILLALLFEQAWVWSDVLLGGLACALMISAGLYLVHPNIGWYVGLSGVLHGLFAIAALRLLPSSRVFAGALLIGLALKLIYEAYFGSQQSPQWLGGAVVEQAHAWGAAAGMLYGLLRTSLQRLSVV